MRLRYLVVLLPVVTILAACDNFSDFNNAATPNVITVTGVWEGTASTTACAPADNAEVDICAVLAAAEDFPFRLDLSQQDDRVAGFLSYAGVVATVGGVVTGDDIIRLAGTATATIEGTLFTIILRSWSTDILGRGIAGSRMSGGWVTEFTVQGTEATARAEHTIISATRTR